LHRSSSSKRMETWFSDWMRTSDDIIIDPFSMLEMLEMLKMLEMHLNLSYISSFICRRKSFKNSGCYLQRMNWIFLSF
jgi:hypothetical protein